MEIHTEEKKGNSCPEIGQIYHTFVFENVSFKYKGQDSYALKKVSIKLRSGERLSVVGLNGEQARPLS